MRIGSGLFLLGIITLVQFNELPSIFTVAAGCVVTGLLSIRFRWIRPSIWYYAGLLWACYSAGTVYEREFSAELEGQTLTASGQVISLPETSNHYAQFDFWIDNLVDHHGRSQASPGKVRLNWYHPYPEIRAGQYLELEVRMKRPHGYRNPHGFDYESWLFQQQIRATGYVRKHIVSDSDRSDGFSVQVPRQLLRSKLDQVLAHGGSGALVLALTIGDQSRIVNSQWQVLTATGTGHLLSISGLHIGLLAILGYLIARWTWPLWPAAACRYPTPRIASLVALIFAATYALLAGFTIPVQRSLIMVAVFTLPGLIDKRIPAADSYALALLVVLLIDPMAVLSASFWLSFGAVLIILLIPVTLKTGNRSLLLHRWLRLQIYIFIGLLLITAIWFNQIAVGGLLANAISIPWVSFITVPLILAGTAILLVHEPSGSFLLGMGSTTLDILWPLLEWMAASDHLVITIAEPSAITVAVAITGTALLMLPAGMPARWCGVFCLLPLFLPQRNLPGYGEFETVILDVGQGLAVVVRTQTHVLLYDTGPGYSTGFNAGRTVVMPYLRGEGDNRIDLLIQSHADSDHIGGLTDVLQNITVKRVITSVPDRINHPYVQPCHAGQEWTWNGITFQILSPAEQGSLTGNNASCVLRVANDRYSILIPGDIEKQAEDDLLAFYPNRLDSTVLIAPHHGSLTSSSPGFIRVVSAEQVIFSAGFLNRFRLPKQDILDRYINSGAIILNSAYAGAIRIQFGTLDFTVTTERGMTSRFWNFNSE